MSGVFSLPRIDLSSERKKIALRLEEIISGCTTFLVTNNRSWTTPLTLPIRIEVNEVPDGLAAAITDTNGTRLEFGPVLVP